MRRSPTADSSTTGTCPTSWAARRGICGCSATAARGRGGWPGGSGCPRTRPARPPGDPGDGGGWARRVARVISLSRYATDLLTRDPEALRLLAEDAELQPRSREKLLDGFTAAPDRDTEGS